MKKKISDLNQLAIVLAIPTFLGLFIYVGLLSLYNNKFTLIPPSNPTIEFSLNINKIGSKVESDFQASEKKLYGFYLNFLFKENDFEDRMRIKKLAGDGFAFDNKGKLYLPKGGEGYPLVLKVIIIKLYKNKETEIFQQKINTHEIGTCCLGATSDSKELVALPLDIGYYKILVETISASPELSKVSVNFEIKLAHRGK